MTAQRHLDRRQDAHVSDLPVQYHHRNEEHTDPPSHRPGQQPDPGDEYRRRHVQAVDEARQRQTYDSDLFHTTCEGTPLIGLVAHQRCLQEPTRQYLGGLDHPGWDRIFDPIRG